MEKQPISLNDDNGLVYIPTPEECDQRYINETREWFDHVVDAIKKTIMLRLVHETPPTSASKSSEVPFFNHPCSPDTKPLYESRVYFCELFLRSPQFIALVKTFRERKWDVSVSLPRDRDGSVGYVNFKPLR